MIQDCPNAAQSRHEYREKRRGPPREIGREFVVACSQMSGIDHPFSLKLTNVGSACQILALRKSICHFLFNFMAEVMYRKHLLVSIGSECYATLPKGQIIPTGTRTNPSISKVPGGGHILIIPITHYPTLSSMPPDLSVPIVAELEQYKSALTRMYAKFGCVPVTFEISILSGRGGHAHVQVVPVPREKGDRIGATFVSEGGLAGVMFEEDAEKALEACSGGRMNYFRVDLPNGKKMVHIIKQDVPFSIQFGR